MMEDNRIGFASPPIITLLLYSFLPIEQPVKVQSLYAIILEIIGSIANGFMTSATCTCYCVCTIGDGTSVYIHTCIPSLF